MKNLRKNISFTQKELAALTGISQSSVSLGEKGSRNIPDNVRNKLNTIHILQQQMAQQKMLQGKVLPHQHEKQLARLEKKLKADLFKAVEDALRTSMALSKMRGTYQSMEGKLNLIRLMKTEAEPASGEMLYLEILEDNTLEKIDRNSPVRQLEERYKIALANAKEQVALQFQKALKKLA